MILGFKTKHTSGEQTYFKEKILASAMIKGFEGFTQKLHTIRSGNRWKKGASIQMATGVRTKYYNQFNAGILELCTVKNVQHIKIFEEKKEYGIFKVSIDNKILSFKEIEILVKNDGFNTVYDFLDFFQFKNFEGQLIHWTDLTY